MTSDVYRIDGPALISFSGQSGAGFMLDASLARTTEP